MSVIVNYRKKVNATKHKKKAKSCFFVCYFLPSIAVPSLYHVCIKSTPPAEKGQVKNIFRTRIKFKVQGSMFKVKKKTVSLTLTAYFSDSDRIQTCNLLIRSQMLYSVEPRSRFEGANIQTFLLKGAGISNFVPYK